MDSVLGRKQRIKNSDWIEIFDKIEQLITKEELDQLVNMMAMVQMVNIINQPEYRKEDSNEERINTSA